MDGALGLDAGYGSAPTIVTTAASRGTPPPHQVHFFFTWCCRPSLLVEGLRLPRETDRHEDPWHTAPNTVPEIRCTRPGTVELSLRGDEAAYGLLIDHYGALVRGIAF